MTANNFESTLMIIKDEKLIYPLSTYAFTVTQNSKHNLQKYIGAQILYKNGVIEEITSIEKKGFYGKNFLEKAKNILVGVHEIDTKLKQVDIPFSELAGSIADLLIIDANKGDSVFDLENVEELSDKIRSASDASQLFQLISIPAPEDCLDVF